jgi:uncharacterized membrane protein YdjX (TVP38/TMEM64 family)
MQSRNSKRTGKAKTGKLSLIISLSLVAILLISYFLFRGFQTKVNEAYHVLTSGDEDRIHEWVSQFGIFGPVVIILALVVQMFLFFVPNVLLIIIAILSYGSFWGSIIALTGMLLACSVGYWIGKYFGRITVNKLIGIKVQQKIANFIKHYGAGAIIVTRLSPFLSNDALSIVAGLLQMNFKKYLLATLTGTIPLVLLIALNGGEKIKTMLIWISLISLVIFIVYIIMDRRRKRKRGK